MINFIFPCDALFFQAGVEKPILKAAVNYMLPLNTSLCIDKIVYRVRDVCFNTDGPVPVMWVELGTIGGDTTWKNAQDFAASETHSDSFAAAYIEALNA